MVLSPQFILKGSMFTQFLNLACVVTGRFQLAVAKDY
jgi:hypothetical protein